MNSFIEILNQWGARFADFAWPMLWQSSLLIVCLFVIEFSLHRRIRASIRYALWLVVLVKLCLPPTLASPTSPIWWLPKTQPPAAPPVHYTVTYASPPLLEFSPGPAPVYVAPESVMTSAAGWLLASGSISVLLLAMLLARWRQVAKRVRSSKHSKRLTAILNETRVLAEVKSMVAVKLAENCMSPAVCGLFHPTILIPQSLAVQFSDEQLRAVLLHELVHLRRRDVWLNCFQALLQIAYWWHPLLWLANARIRRVREEAVDDAVMLALRDQSETYAPTLLEVAKLALNRPLAGLGLVGILESRSALRQRIERLVNLRVPRKAGLTFMSLCGIFVFSVVAVPMGNAPVPMTKQTSSGSDNNVRQTNSSISATAILSARTNRFAAELKTDQLVQDAKLFYAMGKFAEAERKLKSALALDPENQAAHYYLNLVQVAQKARRGGSGETQADRRRMLDELNRVRFDHFGPYAEPLGQVLDELNPLTSGLVFEKSGIQFIVAENPHSRRPTIDPDTGLPVKDTGAKGMDINSVVVSIPRLKNVTLGEILDAIVRGASKPIQYSVSVGGIVFSPKDNFQVPRLLSRTFKVNTNAFLANLQTQVRPGTNVLSALRRLFLIAGVYLTPPETIFYNEKLGLLFVRATEQDLDAIEKLVARLDNPDPQVHIKASFWVVPKQDLAGLEKLIGSTNQLVGILDSQNAKVALKALRARSGFKELAAPEVTTLSGRQTEMRATITRTFITNFTFQEISNVSAVIPQTNTVDTGPVLDIIPFVLADDYTIDLTAIASVTEFLGYDKTTNTITAYTKAGQKVDLPTISPSFDIRNAITHVKLLDGQTLVLGLKNHFYDAGKAMGAEPDYFVRTARTRGQPNEEDKQILVFITATLVDPAGNRIHSEALMPFVTNAIPQPDSP